MFEKQAGAWGSTSGTAIAAPTRRSEPVEFMADWTRSYLDAGVAMQRKEEEEQYAFIPTGAGVASSHALISAAAPVAIVSIRNAVSVFCGRRANGIVSSAMRFLPLVNLAQVNDRWHDLHRSLNRWAALPRDWDGENGIPPSNGVLSAARDFLARLMKAGVVPPRPYVAGDGEVGYRWGQNEAFASVAFLDDGHIIVFCNEPAANEPLKIDEEYSRDLDLSVLLSRLVRFI